MVRKSSHNWCQSFDVCRPTPSPHSHESPSFGTMGEGGEKKRDTELVLKRSQPVLPRRSAVPGQPQFLPAPGCFFLPQPPLLHSAAPPGTARRGGERGGGGQEAVLIASLSVAITDVSDKNLFFYCFLIL